MAPAYDMEDDPFDIVEILRIRKEREDRLAIEEEKLKTEIEKAEINKKKKNYILLTNAPRPNHAVKSFLEKLGMEKEIRDHVFTSGEAALIYLKKNLIDKNFFHVGPPRDFDLFKEFEKDKSQSIENCEYLLCTGLFEKYDEDLNYYKDLFEKNILNITKGSIKLLNVGELTSAINIEVSYASKNAVEKIKGLGGNIKIIKNN